ncbi:hypothetical protein HYC85_000866 [Camellia sinensis]|uniref:Uncharacterized protein n=1 Tax=Camellia sinensis TaxID=4442 RepID=A0A7J7I4V6_CAMSI|nr:hypothetical protein HYC85_000866 [Camellia sinensis]
MKPLKAKGIRFKEQSFPFVCLSFPFFSLSLHCLSSHLTHYHFRHSLIDIPLISLIRSAIILCKFHTTSVYSFCDGPSLSRGPYLGVVTVFCVFIASLFEFDDLGVDRGRYGRAMEVGLFLCSMVLGMGHVVVAYRTSCRERRKLLVYKIDIEAVSPDLSFSVTIHQMCRGHIGQFT